MWFPSKALDILKIATESVQSLREENAALKVKLAAVESELVSTKINSDWLRVQVNQLQLERSGLIEKSYGIKLPAPEIVKKGKVPAEIFANAIFEDQDELTAKYGA